MSRELYTRPIPTRARRPLPKHWTDSDGVLYLISALAFVAILFIIYT